MTARGRRRLSSALLGALIGWALSAVPPFCCLNCCCCLNYFLAGVAAGGLYARRAGRDGAWPLAEDGALAGALAGVFAGLVSGVVDGVLGLIWSSWFESVRALEFLRPPPGFHGADLHELMLGIAAPPWLLIEALAGVLLGGLQGLLGGALGVVIFRRSPTATATSNAPPPPVAAA